ncbi:hypothetical protein [uncultured Sunxiuqinia sp.]|uniref:hypothetical protein n=1 Tax=uncultured Sunxiuqinia sp. TaxID=1573825 RepID=UPI0030DCA180
MKDILSGVNYTIQQRIPRDAGSDLLLARIKAGFNQKRYKTEQIGDRLLFYRQVDKRRVNRYQIISELLKSLPEGEIFIEKQAHPTLVCKISYLKHVVICILLGFLVGLMFSWLQGFDIALIFKIAIPVSVFFIFRGIKNGNAQMKQLLQQAILRARTNQVIE